MSGEEAPGVPPQPAGTAVPSGVGRVNIDASAGRKEGNVSETAETQGPTVPSPANQEKSHAEEEALVKAVAAVDPGAAKQPPDVSENKASEVLTALTREDAVSSLETPQAGSAPTEEDGDSTEGETVAAGDTLGQPAVGETAGQPVEKAVAQVNDAAASEGHGAVDESGGADAEETRDAGDPGRQAGNNQERETIPNPASGGDPAAEAGQVEHKDTSEAPTGVATGAANPDQSAEDAGDGSSKPPEGVDQVRARAEGGSGLTPPPPEGQGAVRAKSSELPTKEEDWEEYLGKYKGAFAPGREQRGNKPGETIGAILAKHGYGELRNVIGQDGHPIINKETNEIKTRPTTLDDIIKDIESRARVEGQHFSTKDDRTLDEKRDILTLKQIRSDATAYHERKVREQLAKEESRRKELMGKGTKTEDEAQELQDLNTKLQNASVQKAASLDRERKDFVEERGFLGRKIDGFARILGAEGSTEQWNQWRGYRKLYRADAKKLWGNFLATKLHIGNGKLEDTQLAEIKEHMEAIGPLMRHARKEWLKAKGLQAILVWFLILGPAAVTILPAIITGKLFQVAGHAPK